MHLLYEAGAYCKTQHILISCKLLLAMLAFSLKRVKRHYLEHSHIVHIILHGELDVERERLFSVEHCLSTRRL